VGSPEDIPRACRDPSGLVGVQPMEFGDETRPHDVVNGDPGPLLWTISFPVDEVLETPSGSIVNAKPSRRDWDHNSVLWVYSTKEAVGTRRRVSGRPCSLGH